MAVDERPFSHYHPGMVTIRSSTIVVLQKCTMHPFHYPIPRK
ncbi:MAG: hypothetical protein M5U34_27690 [Chloroflexi bacterium]|nr:hypothetical protein [Chloroflexota bacterium]